MRHSSIYFYGNKVSEYGLQHKRVDYATLAKAFECVLNNNIISETQNIGYWESETPEYYFEDMDGNIYTEDEAEERKEALQSELEELEETGENTERISEIESDLEALEEYHYHDIYQYYIVSSNAVDILKEAGEIVFYNDTLDMYVWGVTHWGTSWDYVLTDIVLDIEEPKEEPTEELLNLASQYNAQPEAIQAAEKVNA